MMTDDNYKQVLEKEQKKLQALDAQLEKLKSELVAHQKLIKALETLAKDEDSDVDKEIEAVKTSFPGRYPAYIRKDSFPLLQAIKDRSLSAAAIVEACQKRGLTIGHQDVLIRLGLYRRKYGFVESEKRGLYRLTHKAWYFLQLRYPQQFSEDP